MPDFLLLSDGSSYVLQTDGTSKIILGTGGGSFFPVILSATWTFDDGTTTNIKTHAAVWTFDDGLSFFVLADERIGHEYTVMNVGILIDGNTLEGVEYHHLNVGIGSRGWLIGRIPIEGRGSDGVQYQHLDVV